MPRRLDAIHRAWRRGKRGEEEAGPWTESRPMRTALQRRVEEALEIDLVDLGLAGPELIEQAGIQALSSSSTSEKRWSKASTTNNSGW